MIKEKYGHQMKHHIRFLVMDVDGTLTDGKIQMTSQGELFKSFNTKDGYGIKDILPLHNIIPVIITGRKSDIVTRRAAELNVLEVHQEVYNKAEKMDEILSRYQNNLTIDKLYQNVAFIGDDLNDLELMKRINQYHGLSGCPQNASTAIKEICHFVSKFEGGNGAVRDFIEWIITCIS